MSIEIREGKVAFSSHSLAEWEAMGDSRSWSTTLTHSLLHWMQADIRNTMRHGCGAPCDMCEQHAGILIAVRCGEPVLACSSECEGRLNRGEPTPYMLRAPEREAELERERAARRQAARERLAARRADGEVQRRLAEERAASLVFDRYREWAARRKGTA